MSRDDIEVPKELREFMLEGAEETTLGQKNGAKRQFRYGIYTLENMTINF